MRGLAAHFFVSIICSGKEFFYSFNARAKGARCLRRVPLSAMLAICSRFLDELNQPPLGLRFNSLANGSVHLRYERIEVAILA